MPGRVARHGCAPRIRGRAACSDQAAQVIAIILLVMSRVTSWVPLTLLTIALAFIGIVAVVWPTKERRDMVERLGTALKDFGGAISRLLVPRPGRRWWRPSESAEGQSEE
jgi:hypothetical protein